GGALDYFFIYGPEVEKIVRDYTRITGRTPMPPVWSLGYQQCLDCEQAHDRDAVGAPLGIDQQGPQ
ncbi:MAG: glycoside hydrolase family 31 protein, partial [Kiloniellales bacterium]|nr:glycoside hydrolase family 31 protein [Kiloniellales bacterium]